VWIVVRRKRRTRKKVGLRKTKTRKEFINCRCLVPLVGGKPGDFETCQEEVCFVCPLSLFFFFWLLFNLEPVFFPSVVFYFAIVVGSVLSLSLFFAPCCQGFRRRKKKVFWPKKKLRESVCQ
jgi:apolipoprotein N-acyltransferase